ncbi:MAG TPA: hypothetical protein VM536_04825 [Chloroflexia bacterium]|nr:hypothetical protein [Chloroflexia bacterium]
MGIPTHEDAKLMMDLFRLRQDPALQEAERWFLREFKPGPWGDMSERYQLGTPDRGRLETILGYWELVGALVDHGLLNEDLLFDVLGSTEPVWQRMEPWVAAARSELGSDTWENIEILVGRQRRWRQLHRPKSTRL